MRQILTLLLLVVGAAGLMAMAVGAESPPGEQASGPAGAAANNPAAADDLAVPTAGLLLLKNGQNLEGRVSRNGDQYRVELPGGEIRMRAVDVEGFCHDLQQGYRIKRAALHNNTAAEHIHLAEWCARYKLFDLAEKELTDATLLDPNDPMIPVLDRRVKLNRQPEEPAPVARPQSSPPTSRDELDRMIRNMPSGSVETFAQCVQPLLMNHCMSSGCHGPQADNALRLMRAPANQPVPRRLTQRNLYSVLQWVDRDRPQGSRLLTAISGPHGKTKAPVFTGRQATQYQQISAWVYQLAGQSSPDASADILTTNPILGGEDKPAQPRRLPRQAMHGRPMPTSSGLAPEASGGVQQAAGWQYAPGRPMPADRRKPAKPQPQRPEAPAAARPPSDPPQSPSTDPFDPEIFNRQPPPAPKEPKGP